MKEEEGGRGNGGSGFWLSFFFLILQQPTTFPLYTPLSLLNSSSFRGQCKIKIRTHRAEEWNVLIEQGFAFRHRVHLSITLPNYLVRDVSILDVINWKFSASQSLKIQDYQTATMTFFYYSFCCIIVLLNFINFILQYRNNWHLISNHLIDK